ncbi:MAG: TonB-dependent receptor [Crocinitomicaceae bacterium]|nr:TonB-dependent receptor [Crocinitomicaceae bacterium]MDG1658863.1 TonB-dependent receptor [Crocinitomicaceae bacterium]
MNIKNLLFLLLLSLFNCAGAQTGSISGIVTANDLPLEFTKVVLESVGSGTVTNENGFYRIEKIPFGTYQVSAYYDGYIKKTKRVIINESFPKHTIDFELIQEPVLLDVIVITGTKTPKRKINSPVIVNVINSETLNNVQACNLSEGLKFQPGLRVETDCQTCNYTQLRMNGLAGGYSQILINGRPVFSPLTGLYGMEQLPTNMIDRIEVVRGGGSSLYGSSAIGGTVNVITKVPKNNSYELDYNYQNMGAQANGHSISGNVTLVSENKKSGVSFFMNHRERDFYDANQDNFSEIPLSKNTAIGANVFLLPKENQKIELNFSRLHEYRFGGEMITDKPAFLTQQSEERTHNVWMASADYQINFNNDNSSIITYFAWQNTDRNHYTGIQPDTGTVEYDNFITNPPYGMSDVSTYNVGTQINHKVNNFLKGENVFTLGAEYVYDDVLDDIPAYGYLIDQTTTDLGVFLQSDWEILPQLTLLSGVRMDLHNLVDRAIFNPRTSLLYKLKKFTQFRVSYGTGFRAPQAFDADLHIAFAGGGISRVSLSPDLVQENSHSFSTSFNYDKSMKRWIGGFTLEGFYNQLNNAFFLQPIGQDAFGELFEKQNGDGASVQGITLEMRGNFVRKIQLEAGFTLQSSLFDNPVEYIDGVPGIREFTRTPNDYGYALLTLNSPNKKWNGTLNYVYTGEMKVPHFAGAPNQHTDEIVTSKAFSELSAKLGYTLLLKKIRSTIQFYGGVKNIFNAYQNDFDIGKNRDSNYIYGPSQPRTFYVGLKLSSK